MPVHGDISRHAADDRRSGRREPGILPPLRGARLPSAAMRRLQAAALSADHGVSVVHLPDIDLDEGGRARARCTPTKKCTTRIQPAFKAHTPYMVLLVDLDTQKGKPTEHEALRVVGNLTTPDGMLAPPDVVKRGRHRLARADGVQRCSAGICRCRSGRSTKARRSRRSRGAIRRNSPPNYRPIRLLHEPPAILGFFLLFVRT